MTLSLLHLYYVETRLCQFYKMVLQDAKADKDAKV